MTQTSPSKIALPITEEQRETIIKYLVDVGEKTDPRWFIREYYLHDEDEDLLSDFINLGGEL